MNIFNFRKTRQKEKQEKQFTEFFKMIQGYSPVFTSFEGGLYEYERTRAAIHCFATHCSKLKPILTGTSAENKAWEKQLQFKMNPLQNTSQYLYNLATIYMIHNTAFVAPVYNSYDVLTGYYPVIPNNVKLLSYEGKFYYQYVLNNGTFVIESERAGIVNQYLYKSPVFGNSNDALMPTIELLDTNRQGIIEGVKSSANVRFFAKLSNVFNKEDMKLEQKRLREMNLSSDNENGIFIIDGKYENVEQIKSDQFTINAAQEKLINENVNNYFGVNNDILQNKFDDETWEAYYDGKIEPFAIQASLTHTNMTYSEREISFGNSILFSANRLQHMSYDKRVNVGTSLFDRGIMTGNMVAEMFNLPNDIPGGDNYYIRKEYLDMSDIPKQEVNENE